MSDSYSTSGQALSFRAAKQTHAIEFNSQAMHWLFPAWALKYLICSFLLCSVPQEVDDTYYLASSDPSSSLFQFRFGQRNSWEQLEGGNTSLNLAAPLAFGEVVASSC